MKKYNFLKKVCSVVLAVAMLASLGVTAFANTTATVTIGEVEPTKIADGVYEVEVKYTVTGTTNIGVTMLTYAGTKADGSDLTADTPYNDATMQIVGIDQKSGNGDGTFTFAVTAVAAGDTSNANNGITVVYDEPTVVMVGGDNIEAPAAALFTIPTPPQSVEAATAEITDNVAVGKFSYEDAQTAIAATEVTANVKDSAGTVIGTVTLVPTGVTATVLDAEAGTYEVEATIPTGTTVTAATGYENYEITIPAAGLPVEYTAVVTTKPWEADTYGTVANFSVGYTTDLTEAEVKAKLVGKTVEVSNADLVAAGKNAKATVTITDGMITDYTGADYTKPNAVAIDAEYKYTVTIPDGAEYKAAASATNNFVVTITITEEAPEPDVVYGDITGSNGSPDGKIDMLDVSLAFAAFKNKSTLTADQITAGDVQPNGVVDMSDVSLLFARFKNKNSVFPVEE